MAVEEKSSEGGNSNEASIPSNYREIFINNVDGNLVKDGIWSVSNRFSMSAAIDELGRTKIHAAEKTPAYIVCGGTDSNFRVLEVGRGSSVGDSNALRVYSSFLHNHSLKVLIVLIEFNENLERIGDVTLASNSGNLVKLLPETKFVLPTIRLAGQGELVINWLRLDAFTADSPTEMERTNQIEVLTVGDPSDIAAIRSGFSQAQKQLSALSQAVSRLNKHSSIETEKRGGEQQLGGQSALQAHQNSRDDGEISAFRENFSRELLLAMASSLPNSRGSRHYDKIPLTLGIITDEYMFNFYKDVFERVVYFTPDNYSEQLENESVDIVLYVTCWKGIENEEWKGVKFRERPMKALDGILSWAREKSVPTVFQSIEDPSNFEYFLPVAKNFDFVFTSDTDVIPKYKESLGHDRVFYGEYGANPAVNNPVGSWRFNLNRALFAGSYPERYPERTQDMEIIFDSIPNRKENLLILDRNFESSGYGFPARFQESIVGPVNHEALQKLHKMFRFSLNFNSIKSSPTMCAMRVYELQAQGLPIISNYARSVFNKFPAIRIVPELTVLTEFESKETNFSELCVANELMVDVQLQKNAFEIVNLMCQTVGLKTPDLKKRNVLLLAEGDEQAIKAFLSAQTHSEIKVTDSVEEFTALQSSAAFEYVGAIDPSRQYEPTYISSRLAAFVYTDSDFVTQKAYFNGNDFVEGLVHEFVDNTSDRFATLIDSNFQEANAFVTGKNELIQGKGYAADPFGIGYTQFEKAQIAMQDKGTRKLSVIIPVYNNGEFLVSKCIESIKKNKSWLDFEILLIDDGSDDIETQAICRDLESKYPNVQYFTFNDGGSGSASRPRNKGVELASAELITYLDPDNEVSPGGYDALLEQFESMEKAGIITDFVSGYQVKVGEKVLRTGKHAGDEPVIVEDTDVQFFDRGKFPVVSTQASVIRKQMLVDNEIRFIEGAAGQDTLYGWEVVHYAKNPTFVSNAYIIYYAERDGSVTNNFGLGYFEKCLVLEEAQVESLGKMGQLEKFREGHFENFMRNWYLKRLEQVGSDRDAVEDVLRNIIVLYGRNPDNYLVKEI